MIPADITQKILVIGPHYKDHRGGIGALISIQKDYYAKFNFIPTYNYHSTNFLKAWFFLKQLIKIIKYLSHDPDLKVVHVHSSIKGSFYRKFIVILIAKFLFKKKVINHLHAGDYDVIYNNSNFLSKKIIESYFRISDVTFTVSQKWMEFIYTQFRLNSIYVIHNIIPKALAETRQNRSSQITFLFLGLIGHNKGVFDILEVIIQNKPDLIGKARFVLAGNGEIERLQEIIVDNQLNDIVEFKGWVQGVEKERLFHESDVFLLPSYSEGMPVSILEAMSYGLPIISTNVGGIPEVVKQDINGDLLEPGDHIALLTCMKSYLDSPEKVFSRGLGSLEIIQDYFPEVVMPKIESVYNLMVKDDRNT